MEAPKQLKRQSGVGTRAFLRFVEEHGMALRRQAGLGPRDRLDPFSATEAFGIVVVNPRDLEGLAKEDHDHLQGVNARTWSGGAQELPDGRLLILLNPNQTPERAVVTVMEEVAHAHFEHRPSTLLPEPTGLLGRHYNVEAEREAYWTAAAALLPSKVVAHAVWDLIPAEVFAAEYGVSVELVEFRIKTLRLWPWYCERRAAA